MGYDPIDTDETDSKADKEITVDAINGADTSAAAAGEALTSDGSGQLQFSDPAGVVPTGGIIMWSGSIANIPSGFALCDGTNSTPDLTDRFVVGAGGSESVGDTGGTDTQSVNVSVSGTTDDAEFKGTTKTMNPNDNDFPSPFGQIDDDATDSGPDSFVAQHRQSGDITRGGGSWGQSEPYKPLKADFSGSGSDSFDNRPAYYSLAYIMKT